MTQLNESGVSDETTCPYCGYEQAHDEYESRGEFEIIWRGKKYDGYTNWSQCPLCGWEMISAEDDHYEYIINDFLDSVTDKELGIKEEDFEDEDDYYDARMNAADIIAPPQEHEIKPKLEIVKLAKQVIKNIYKPFWSFIKYGLDIEEELARAFIDVTWEMPAESDVKQKEMLINFRQLIIKGIFE